MNDLQTPSLSQTASSYSDCSERKDEKGEMHTHRYISSCLFGEIRSSFIRPCIYFKHYYR